MGTLDSNQIWRYDNDDQVTPLATFMNLLSTSVSNAIDVLSTSLQVPDTGWVACSLSLNTTESSENPAVVRRYGNVVEVKGRLERPTNSGAQLYCTIPATASGLSLRPNTTREIGGAFMTNASARPHINTDGSVRVSNMPSGAATFAFSATYLV